MANKRYDLTVIGTGSAGATVAHECRAAGWEVAVVDSRPYGGTCALRGCDPKKVLVGAAELVDWHRRMEGRGVEGSDVRIDWGALMQFKRTFTDPVPVQREQSFAQAGIATYHGPARFIDKTALQVGSDTLTARFVVIATGAKPRDLGIPGAEHAATSERFLALDSLPRRIVFIGGGYISFEFAHIAARAGAEVAIVQRGERPLKHFDPDLVAQLVDASRAAGIDVQLQTAVESIEQTNEGLLVHSTANGNHRSMAADLAVHGAGRVPEIEALDLDAAGVQWSAAGVRVNAYLQSVSNPAVYAAGDAAASNGPLLTPVAGAEGRAVAANLLNGNHRQPDYTATPSVVFSIPPLASVGLLEETASAQGLKFTAKRGDTSGWYSSRRTNEQHAGFKVLIEEGSGRILGAHLLGAHAEEVINVFALAMRAGLRNTDLKAMLYAYPTRASDIQYMV